MSIKYKDRYIFGGSGNINIPAGGKEGQVLVKKSDSDYDVEWVDDFYSILNPNLLDNWYFIGGQFPINQNGQREYTTKGYTIDRWMSSSSEVNSTIEISLSDIDGLGLSTTLESEAEVSGLSQVINNSFSGKTLTLSIFVKSIVGTLCLAARSDSWSATYEQLIIKDPGVHSFTVSIPDGSFEKFRFAFYSTSTRYLNANIIAVKLELGERQTLAHQDESGNWILNAVPNHAEQYDICKQYSPITGEFVGIQHSNPNLLYNWYFVGDQFPINRRGRTEYTDVGYTIDRWMTWTTSGIMVDKISLVINGSSNFGQALEGEFLTHNGNKQMTLSILLSDGTLHCGTAIVPSSFQTYDPIVVFRNDKVAGAYQRHDNSDKSLRVVFDAYEQCRPIAAKLEFGPIQTLAHKEGDTWMLNEIPNYAEQYTICSQYSPITGEFVGSQHSNPNLLDNWYFIGGGSQKGAGQFPINQRGDASSEAYNNSSYFIDRWRIDSGVLAQIIDSGISISKKITGSGEAIIQIQENSKNYLGQMMTFSVLTSDNEFLTATGKVPTEYPSGSDDAIATSFGTGANISFRINNVFTYAAIYCNIGITSVIVAAKLEFGPIQTLAHKEGDKWVLNDPSPNYELELKKCQRYQINLVHNASPQYGLIGIGKTRSTNQINPFIPLPTPLRCIPRVVWSGNFMVNEAHVKTIDFDRMTENGVTVVVILENGSLTPGDIGELWYYSEAEKNKFILDANL